ncbi:hypothetical protein KDA00_00915 [Candidatus Saccharibacteria bacterium]|nr:hypothetical protein [Candidatus Saccharibacteria bacterium]
MKKNLITVAVLSIIVGLGGGYLIANTMSDSTDSHMHEETMIAESDDHSSESMTHAHEMFTVDKENAPTVSFTVEEDAKSGWNIKVVTTNFTFTPENVNGDNIAGEGHAHLYVDNVKVARLYGPYYHYDGSFDGTKTFKVTLNANDHSEYAVDGQVIQAEQQVTHIH